MSHPMSFGISGTQGHCRTQLRKAIRLVPAGMADQGEEPCGEWFYFQRIWEQMKSVSQGPDVGHYGREPLHKSTAKDLAPEATGRTKQPP